MSEQAFRAGAFVRAHVQRLQAVSGSLAVGGGGGGGGGGVVDRSAGLSSAAARDVPRVRVGLVEQCFVADLIQGAGARMAEEEQATVGMGVSAGGGLKSQAPVGLRGGGEDLEKVLTVLATLCDEVADMQRVAEQEHFPALSLFGEPVPRAASGDAPPAADLGHATQQIGASLPFLMDLNNFVSRLRALTRGIVQQLASLYHARRKEFQTTFRHVRLLPCFRALATTLEMLISLDAIVLSKPAISRAWSRYKGMMQIVREDPGAYGVSDEVELRSFEKALLEIDRTLLSARSFADAVEQDFEIRGPRAEPGGSAGELPLQVGDNQAFMNELGHAVGSLVGVIVSSTRTAATRPPPYHDEASIRSSSSPGGSQTSAQQQQQQQQQQGATGATGSTFARWIRNTSAFRPAASHGAGGGTQQPLASVGGGRGRRRGSIDTATAMAGTSAGDAAKDGVELHKPALSDALERSIVGVTGMYVLMTRLAPSTARPDSALFARLWSSQQVIPVVALPGNAPWFMDSFLREFAVLPPVAKLKPKDPPLFRREYVLKLGETLQQRVDLLRGCALAWCADVESLMPTIEAAWGSLLTLLESRSGVIESMEDVWVHGDAVQTVSEFASRLSQLVLAGVELARRTRRVLLHVLTLHASERIPMSKRMILPLMQCAELLKTLQSTVRAKSSVLEDMHVFTNQRALARVRNDLRGWRIKLDTVRRLDARTRDPRCGAGCPRHARVAVADSVQDPVARGKHCG